jgi:hypothetical protein
MTTLGDKTRGPKPIEVKRLWRQDRKRWVAIGRVGSVFTFAEDADVTGIPYENWPALARGGLYETVEAAEREARASVPWLAAISN